MLELKDVSGGYGSEKIIKQASFSVKKGEIFGILGPNGSGKTTLLKMISGALPFEEGEILLEGKNIRDFKAKELAKAMAVLPQQTEASFSYKVKDIVMLGRYPHQKGIFQHESAHDNDVVKSAMKQTGVLKYENKTLQSLSGGERQRVMLARALAQEPKLLLLDEPTNHLDISYQMSLLNTLKNWSIKNDLTVIAILHDLNMASLYCDRLLLLHNGEMSALNKPAQVMNEERLQHVYQADIDRTEHPTVPSPLITLVPTVEQKGQCSFLEELSVEQNDELIVIKSPFLLKTFSSAVIGAGFGWKETFVNRFVDKNYDSDNAEEEYKQFLETKQIEVEETIGMMTAAILEDASFMKQEEEDFSLFVVVTAGVSNAVDVAKAYLQEATPLTVGTINTWIFVDGELSEAAFVQGMMTATEAKVKAMMEEKVLDPVTETIATGTSTDSLMIAATQQGAKIEYAGTITPLGKAIGRTVFEATSMAIKKNKVRRKRL